MKIYTKTGDKGQTSLLFGQRVEKDDLRVEAYGTVDEANSALGLALSYMDPQNAATAALFEELLSVQRVLFNIGAELATPSGRRPGWEADQEQIDALERLIDALDAKIPPLTSFVLPGGCPAGAGLHLARTVVRRAERLAVKVARDQELNPLVVIYLNRLSDALFNAARFVNHVSGTPEPAGPAPKALQRNAETK